MTNALKFTAKLALTVILFVSFASVAHDAFLGLGATDNGWTLAGAWLVGFTITPDIF